MISHSDGRRSMFATRPSSGFAIQRMANNGAEIVTSEVVIFEWLETCEHPKFREILALVK